MSVTLNQDLRERLSAIFRNLSHVFVFEQIPPRKLRNATRSYAPAMGPDETVIALYDDTVFGSSKEGFLLTTGRLYGKNIAERGSFVELRDITHFTLETGGIAPEALAHTGSGVVLRKHLITSNSSGQSAALFEALQQAVTLLQNPNGVSAANENAQQQSAGRCGACGAVGQGAVCEYCGSPVR